MKSDDTPVEVVARLHVDFLQVKKKYSYDQLSMKKDKFYIRKRFIA